MENIDLHILKEAIFEYREEGKKLMLDLGKKFGLDITIPEEYNSLITRSNKTIPRKGELTKRWNYYFHGVQCGFYNKKHKRTVEVELSNPPEFGELDAWFVMLYMESTEKYKDAVKGVKWTDLKPAIQKLYDRYEIEYIKR